LKKSNSLLSKLRKKNRVFYTHGLNRPRWSSWTKRRTSKTKI